LTTQFICNSPAKVFVTKAHKTKLIQKDEIEKFWQENPRHKSEMGCYVFAMKASKGVTPLYVGKATKSFGQEVFTSHKIVKYLSAMAKYKSGTPQMYFISYPQKKGVVNSKHISALEKFLIQQAIIANPYLSNIKNSAPPAWGISGVVRSRTKKPTAAAKSLKALLGF
jgi:hypothetical protein